MNNYIKFLVISVALNFGYNSFSQANHTLDSLISLNTKTFEYNGQTFKGDGWNQIIGNSTSVQNVMVGEDHFSNEIPAFIKALSQQIKFDNFYIEIDPYSTQIIENVIHNYNLEDKNKFFSNYGDLLSFYSLKPEYDLLEYIATSGTKLLGSDQIVMYSDRLVFQDLIKTTEKIEAKKLYNDIIEQSKIHFESFLQNPQNPMYMMTPDFSEQLDLLSDLNLSEKEYQIIEDLKKSKTIYTEQNHKMRVKLIMNQVMKDYPLWVNSKNLFKYGANHLTRGESFLANFDIGNLVTNITESNFKESFHIMIVGESGFLGSPFRTFPESPVDSENGFYLSYLKPFFKITDNKDWYAFDLLPLRKALIKNKLIIEKKNLERVIEGYDVLVIIPEVTAAKF